MSLFDRKARKIMEFIEAMLRDGKLDTMNPEKREIVESFARRYREHLEPNDALRDYRLRIAPLLAIFARTRRLTTVIINLLVGWSIAMGIEAEVKAETGALVLGDDEEQDLDRMQRFAAVFVKFFKVEALPLPLRKEELHKQVQQHLQARKAMPPLPPKDKLTELNADKRTLAEHCDLAFNTFHDHLDGYFGAKGDEALRRKAVYGYDRSAGKYKPSAAAAKKAKEQKAKAKAEKKARAEAKAAADAKAESEAQAKAQAKAQDEGSTRPDTLTESSLVPKAPGPVASGTAARVTPASNAGSVASSSATPGSSAEAGKIAEA